MCWNHNWLSNRLSQVCLFWYVSKLSSILTKSNIKGCRFFWSWPWTGLWQDLQELKGFWLYQKRFRAILLIQLILRNKARHDFHAEWISMQNKSGLLCATSQITYLTKHDTKERGNIIFFRSGVLPPIDYLNDASVRGSLLKYPTHPTGACWARYGLQTAYYLQRVCQLCSIFPVAIF